MLFMARSEAAKAAYSATSLRVGSRPKDTMTWRALWAGWVSTNVRDHAPPLYAS